MVEELSVARPRFADQLDEHERKETDVIQRAEYWDTGAAD